MNHLQHLRSRGWILLVVATAFIAGHLILFRVLRHSVASHVALPSAILAGVVLLVIAKHFGMFGVLLRVLFRGRS